MPFFSSGEYIIYMKIELCYSNEEWIDLLFIEIFYSKFLL
jgi:hypothetical protein